MRQADDGTFASDCRGEISYHYESRAWGVKRDNPLSPDGGFRTSLEAVEIASHSPVFLGARRMRQV
jgi:hypothetical protein